MKGEASPKRLVVGISGASGAEVGVQVLKALRRIPGWETHLVISHDAQHTLSEETPYSLEEVKTLASHCYAPEDVGASIASGTFKTEGMVVAPCSMKTVAGIAHGFSHNLLIRAADVTIKERRKLVLVPRETPLSPVHLGNLLTLANLGVVILPPVLTFYDHPVTIEEMVMQLVGRILDIFGLEVTGFKRWGDRLQLAADLD
jgi:polyprenyl P-hydroxybenzoate/phenylacrylic acid decarboxylase-like protein